MIDSFHCDKLLPLHYEITDFHHILIILLISTVRHLEKKCFNMDLTNTIQYEISKISIIKEIDPRQLPCIFCVRGIETRNEMLKVLSLTIRTLAKS